MTVSAEKLRVNPVIAGRAKSIPCGTVIGPAENMQIVFLQDYKSTFTGNMPDTSVGEWSANYQIMDYVVSCVARAWPNAEIGLAHFSDHPVAPYGNPDEDFVYQEILPLTKVSNIFPMQWNSYAYTAAQHGGLYSVDGGDQLNCALDAISAAAASTSMGWNFMSYINKFIIVFTDELPHDSDKETGVPHISQMSMEDTCRYYSVRPIYVLINDAYNAINKKFEFNNIDKFFVNDDNSLLFGKTPLFTGSPSWTVNSHIVSERILASIYNLSTTQQANE